MDRAKVIEILEVQRGRDDSLKGMQPELTLSCFYGKNRSDTVLCEKCKIYEGCYSILKIGLIERKPFARD